MTDLVFFYGTLMSGFKREGRASLDEQLEPVGRGWIRGALFDLGIYPAAIPAADGRIWGEVHRMLNPLPVLRALDEIACTVGRTLKSGTKVTFEVSDAGVS